MPRIFYLCLVFLLINSCRKKHANYPAIPDLPAGNISIMNLKKKYIQAGTFVKITEDLRISGIVIANDESGNFYKKIIVQDSSGGIALSIDGYDLYKEYPVGRQIVVICRGLTLNDFANNISLGLKQDEDDSLQLLAIPAQIANKFIQKGSFEHKVEPKLVKIADLTTDLHDPYQNTLLRLTGVEARAGDAGKTLADPTKRFPARAYTLYECAGESIVLRTSSYSVLASTAMPEGNGSIIGVFTPFVRDRKNEKNITLRKAQEINFGDSRCPDDPSKKRGRRQSAKNSGKQNKP